MIIEENKLIADKNKVLTKDGIRSHTVYLAKNANPEEWIEVDMNEEEILEQKQQNIENYTIQIEQLKNELSTTDYKAIKYAEGWLNEQEYASIKIERQNLRDQINLLEQKILDNK